MRKYCPESITSLKPNQVFVFGSNEQGFHGAGAAGLAQRGTSRNNWRGDKAFLEALDSPSISEKRKGRWSFLGKGRGYQEGKDGSSYAIATVLRAGKRKSIRLSKILEQLIELGEFAKEHPEKEFLVVIAGGGYNGWSIKDIQGIHKTWCKEEPPSENILLKKKYDFRLIPA